MDARQRKLIAELGFAPKDFIQKKYLEFSKNADYNEITSSKTAFVFQHIRAHKKDLKENLAAAKTLYQNGYSVIVTEHVFSDSGKKNPEFSIFFTNDDDGVKRGFEFLSDLKTPDPNKYTSLITSIKGQFTSGRKQKLTHIIIDIVNENEPLEVIAEGLRMGFQKKIRIEEVLILRRNKVARISRRDFNNDLILRKLEKAFK